MKAARITMAIMMAAPAAIPAAARGQAMPAYPDIPADLAKAAELFDRGQVKGDRAALQEVMADDYLLINSQDKREDKAQFIADYTAPGFTMDPFRIDDRVTLVWSDGAVLGGSVQMTGMSEGKPYSVRIRFSDIWAKRDGRWRIIYTHASRVPAAK